MTRKYLDMNQHDALYSVARRYPGGLELLAKDIGMSANVLRNKLSPTITTHYPSFEEVSIIVEHCHKAGVAEAVSEALMDGVVTSAEADLIEREFHSALSALGAWRARLRMRTGGQGKD